MYGRISEIHFGFIETGRKGVMSMGIKRKGKGVVGWRAGPDGNMKEWSDEGDKS